MNAYQSNALKVQLYEAERALEQSFQRTSFGLAMLCTEDEFTKSLKQYKMLYNALHGDEDLIYFYDFVRYELYIQEAQHSLSVARASSELLSTLDMVAVLFFYGDDDYYKAQHDYYEQYLDFCVHWPHLKAALPTPESIYADDLPLWLTAPILAA